MNSSNSLLEVKDFSHCFKSSGGVNVCLYHGISFSINKGECVLIEGPNGSGKSTLLRMMYGSFNPTGGLLINSARETRLFSQNIRDYAGFHLTVCEQVNLLSSSCPIFPSTRKARAYAVEILKTVGLGLETRLDDYLLHLSGGQVQALMLSAFLAKDPPDLLLLDEHSTALDNQVQEAVMKLIMRCIDDFDVTVIMVTHSPESVAGLNPRSIQLSPPEYRAKDN